MTDKLTVRTRGQGLYEITAEVENLLQSGAINNGLCTLLVQHTSASLLIQENADPSAKYDLEQWLNRLVKEDDPHYTHRNEGPDDMPAHIKSALTATSLSIPITSGKLALGTWQGIFLWEHRHTGGERHIAIHISN